MKQVLIVLLIMFCFPYGLQAEESQSHCLELTENNVEICVELENQHIECEVSPVGDFIESCEVELQYNIESDYEGDSYVKTFVECVASTLITRANKSTEFIEDANEDHFALFEDADSDQSMTFYFSYGLSANVAHSDLGQAECYVVEASVW